MRDQRYECAYIFGAVCPARGVGAALVMPFANTHAMNAHLAEIGSQVEEGAHAIVIIDGADWHTTKSLKLPSNISLLRLPAYSPELNPQESIWQYLRQNSLANRAYETYDTIVTACCKAGNDLINLPDTIKSITTREWFTGRSQGRTEGLDRICLGTDRLPSAYGARQSAW
ncbi:DDE superfamily endonuclease, partial [Novosphingobium sp. CF614]